MAGEIFTIVKQGKDCRVFRGDAVGEPMDEPDERQTVWLAAQPRILYGTGFKDYSRDG